VRFLSVLLGVVTLLFVWALARTIFPTTPAGWLGTTALVAFVPMFTYLSGVINNDALLAPVFAAIGWRWARVLRFGAGRREVLLLGLLLAVGLNVKETALALLPVTAIVFAIEGPRPWRARLANMVICLAPAAVLGGWWFARKWAIYSTPFVYPFVYPLLDLAPAERAALAAALPRQIFLFSVLPYDVIKGQVNTDLLARLFGVLAVLSAGGFALALLRRKRAPMPRGEALTLFILLGAAVVVLGGLVRNILTVDWRMGTSGGRYLVSVLPLVAPVAARGLWSLFGERRAAKTALAVIALLLLAANLYVIWGTAAEYGTLALR
jgi:4-amino-4-deoxy-L-arabinose transferase-like glycosyltransferase